MFRCSLVSNDWYLRKLSISWTSQTFVEKQPAYCRLSKKSEPVSELHRMSNACGKWTIKGAFISPHLTSPQLNWTKQGRSTPQDWNLSDQTQLSSDETMRTLVNGPFILSVIPPQPHLNWPHFVRTECTVIGRSCGKLDAS